MDSEYLKANVNVALMEGLASMAIARPDDCVDYLGKYLLQYVERGALRIKEKETLDKVLSDAKVYEKEEMEKEKVINDERSKKEVYEDKLRYFLETLGGISNSKQDCMDKCTRFLTDYLNIPSSYVAVKKVVNEVETLYYVSASGNEKVILGKKLPKPIDDGDEPPVRQGFSFEAFKIPEVSEEPEAEEEEEDPDNPQPKEPKAPPGPVPLVIDNVMRDKRTKFFGIPKLGAFVAVPLTGLETIEHADGCQSSSADVHRGPFQKNPIPAPMLLCMDTIGSYRTFTPKEVEIAKKVGDRMAALIPELEHKMFEAHENYLNEQVQEIKTIVDLSVKLMELEEAAVAALQPEPEESPEVIKFFHEAEARVSEYTKAISTSPFQPVFCALDKHVLPVPQPVLSLLHAAGVLVGIGSKDFKDPSGDISWKLTQKLLYQILGGVGRWDPTGVRRVSRDESLAAIKAFVEANGITDSNVFPQHLPVLKVLHGWLLKAIALREVAISMKQQTEKVEIEIIV